MTSTWRWIVSWAVTIVMVWFAMRTYSLGRSAALWPAAIMLVYTVWAWWGARPAAASSATSAAWQRPPEETRTVVPITVKVFAAVGGAFVLFLVGSHYIDKWHPAVQEHRAELLDAAAKASSCAPDELTIVAQKPKRARVEGCGQTRFFLWGQRNKGDKVHWREIDPNCTVDWLGFHLSCY